MQKLKSWLPSKRKLMQLYFGLLFNVNMKGYISGNIYQGNTKVMCVPGMNCYSCPGAVGACPLGSLQGSFSAGKSTVFYVCGILLLYGLLFGRMICGWLCPFGLIQDLLHKVKTPKVKKSPVTRALSFLKYALLVFFVLIVPITYAFRDTPLPAFCKYICPAGTLEGGMLLLSNHFVNTTFFQSLGYLFTWKFMLMVSILVGCIFIFRLFCRFICPLGALYGLFNRFSFFGVKVETSKCTDCGLCVSNCKVDIKKVGDQECISCGDCVEVCPTKAIVWKGPKIFVKANDIPADNKKRLVTRIITAVVMLAVLVGAGVYYWNTTPALPTTEPPEATTEPTGLPCGTQVGMLCPGAQLQIVDGAGVSDQTIDPTQTGKVTVINFWGTWCTPCVNELPYFDQIATEYSGSVTVVAVHSLLANNTMAQYIADHYPESEMIFVTDYGSGNTSQYYTLLSDGGAAGYPYTVVLDENGVITGVFPSTMEYEDLKAAVEDALTK